MTPGKRGERPPVYGRALPRNSPNLLNPTYCSTVTTSPPAAVPSAFQATKSMLLVMKPTDPSQRATLTTARMQAACAHHAWTSRSCGGRAGHKMGCHRHTNTTGDNVGQCAVGGIKVTKPWHCPTMKIRASRFGDLAILPTPSACCSYHR